MAESLFQLRQAQGVWVVQVLLSRMAQGPPVQELFEQLEQLVREKAARVVLDLGQVEFLSSFALGKLVVLQRRTQQQGGWLRLAGLRPQLQELFRITMLDQLFEVFPQVQEALSEKSDSVSFAKPS